MAVDYKSLPVYEQKERILETLKTNQVIVVQSPTGSGKTTQLPVILHEAGYSANGMIAVTQPRRIAALSVSEFIAKQLGTTFPGVVGYKMRFEDKTDSTTKIKIMTDGILLQEMKLDPWLSKYSVVMVDEAHERSLNIDFVLGLLKRVLSERKDFKVIVSSATMNAEAFSNYFDACPIVTIDTITYPITVIYDPPSIPADTTTETAAEALLGKIEQIIDRILDNKEQGDILVFLPGEKIIKDCMKRLTNADFSRKIHIVPLYGRLSKEEQEKVFDKAPFGKKKVVISTNIAETSVTIAGITNVIDSGLAKLNHYNPHTFTSSLNELAVSKASCNQRRGRAGRTCPGTCYRLYTRSDFEKREMYTTEEIYRTDLSEVVLRMSELGITDFEKFDFISPPGHEGMKSAVETLKMLKAIEDDNTLSPIGKMMCLFPLDPRTSRIIVEAIRNYPDVIEESLIAAAFLSAQSPFILPPGEEMDARKAHHSFRDIQGDFVSYVKLFRTYTSMKNKTTFCENYYLDERVMAEIENIKLQLEEIVSNMQIPLTGGGSIEDYLCCIAAGMIQFVCVREGRENYRTLTAEHISIHPGSSMFKQDPLYIVAGEIVRTSRMYAMSVSPLTKNIIYRIDPALDERLNAKRAKRAKDIAEVQKAKTVKDSFKRNSKKDDSRADKTAAATDSDNMLKLGGVIFNIEKIKGKKTLLLPLADLQKAAPYIADEDEGKIKQLSKLKGKVLIKGSSLLSGEKMELILKLAQKLDLNPIAEANWNRKLNIRLGEDDGAEEELVKSLSSVLRVADATNKRKEMGFVTLYTDGAGTYWFKVSRGFATALNESLASLEALVDETSVSLSEEQKGIANAVYRRLHELFD